MNTLLGSQDCIIYNVHMCYYILHGFTIKQLSDFVPIIIYLDEQRTLLDIPQRRQIHQ